MTREKQLDQWLKAQWPERPPRPVAASGDASFRRYFRIEVAEQRYIIMDAPPEHEDCRPFADIAERLSRAGLHAPAILACDFEQGFMLLEDLGPTLYLDVLSDENADALYAAAIDGIVRMQRDVSAAGLPSFMSLCFEREFELFTHWLLGVHLGLELSPAELEMLDGVREVLRAALTDQPAVFVHRDYHSRNLIICEHGPAPAAANPGILDFQDAVSGPLCYDLASLLRDCYVTWPPPRVTAWSERYRRAVGALADVDVATFTRWFDLTGVQRHLKAAGIFARLAHRDRKPAYLADIPRTLQYVTAAAECYPELGGLDRLIRETLLPVFSPRSDR